MMFNCPVCGRLKCSYWPEHWVFLRGDTFYCSETCYCIDLFRDMNLIKQVELERRQRKVGKLTLEIKKKAVQIAIDGGDPLKYLADCGYTAPDKMWYYIKQKVKENDPKLYAQIPDQRKGKKPEVPEPVSGGPWEKAEVPAGEFELYSGPDLVAKMPADEGLTEMKANGFRLPAYIDGFEICGISGQFGTYRASAEHNYFEFVPFGGELCMKPGDWHDQIKELNRAAKVLGVEL